MNKCQTCSDGSTCSSCQSPYYLRLDGTCQTDCSSSQQDKNGDHQCELCNQALPNCLDCNLAGTVCNQCQTGYFIQDNTCYLCSSYLNDCVACSDKSTCTKCSTKYLYSGQCQNTCPSTQQDKNGVRICKDCSLVLMNCLECTLDGLQCTICIDGYYVGTDFQCHQCSDTNCQTCLNKGNVQESISKCSSNCPITEQDTDGDRKCKLCSAVLSNCIECTEDGLKCLVCSQNSVLEQDGLCYPCSSIDTSCINCSDKNTCTECNSPFKLSQNKCINNCPITEQDKDGDRKCKLCSAVLSNCIECTEDGLKCSICNQNSILEADNFCYSCSSIGTNCISCSDKNTCTECNSPFKLSQNKCINSCPITEQDKDGDRKCKLCSAVLSNCIECTEDGLKCLVCSQNSVLEQDGLCYPCSSIDTSCINCSDKNTCTECNSPFKLSQNKCINNCPITEQDKDGDRKCKLCSAVLSNCIECTEDGLKCSICNQNSILEADNFCYSCSSIGTNCISCSDKNTCTECNSPFKFSQNKCINSCPITEQDKDGDRKCKLCSAVLSNCIECTENGLKCSICNQNSVLEQDGLCYPCNSIDINCINCSDKNTCIECKIPYKLSQNKCINSCPITEQDTDGDRKCKPCSAVLSNCIECTEDGLKCSVCSQNSILEADNFCYSCSSIDTNCISCSDKNTCTECNSPFKLSQNKCINSCPITEQDKDGDRKCKLCSQELNNCLQCSEDGIVCLNCEKGFYINSQDQCEICSQNIQNCSNCSLNGSVCFNCFSPLKLQSNVCVDECFKNYYYDAQNICQFCNKKLTQNECKDQCSQFEQDTDKDNVCQPCNLTIDNCQKCHESNDKLICDACYTNYGLGENTCFLCSEIHQDCTKCKQKGICLECRSLMLSNNTCQTQCDDTEQDYDNDQVCLPCSQEIQNCNKCKKQSKQCFECLSGFFLNNDNQCKQCSVIHPNCIQCLNSTDCTQCSDLKLSNGNCFEKCPSTEQDQSKSGVCSPCSQTIDYCSECSEDGSLCLSCFFSYSLTENNSCDSSKTQEEQEEKQSNQQKDEEPK